jgi:glycosyltransferase involved in cell wall biosynthesis
MFLTGSQFSIDLHRARGLDAPMMRFPYFDPTAAEQNDYSSDIQPKGENERKRVSDRPYFLYVGRLEKLKGPQTLLPVFRDYSKARLVVAGTGDLEPDLRQLAGVNENVEILGYVRHEQLTALYRNAVALIVPSINFEGAPLVIVEAYRHGTPVLARRIGAIAEMVKESEGGLLYETNAELLDRMDQLMADASLRAGLGAAGHAAYRRDHTPDVHLQRYFALIESLAAQKSR